MNSFLKFLPKLSLVFLFFLVAYYGYVGLTSLYYEGDSLNYHIPIATAYLDGLVIHPDAIKGVPFLKYSPGSSEAIIALLMILKIPINIFNVIGAVFLFSTAYFAARYFKLEKDYSLIFAGTIISLHIVSRWINTQVIDLWMVGWYLFLLALLNRPKNTSWYYLLLGIGSGMFLGTKYSAIFFLVPLVIYAKDVLKNINIPRLIVFAVPFSLLGLSWYIRNLIFLGNPYYPQPFLFFKHASFPIFSSPVWKSTLLKKDGIAHFLNANISELGIYSLIFLSPLLILHKKIRVLRFSKLIYISLWNLVVYFFMPSDIYYNISVSSFRYGLPAFIPLILVSFLLFKELKLKKIAGLFMLGNILIVLPFYSYHPKLVFLLASVLLIFFYFGGIRGAIRGKFLLAREKKA